MNIASVVSKRIRRHFLSPTEAVPFRPMLRYLPETWIRLTGARLSHIRGTHTAHPARFFVGLNARPTVRKPSSTIEPSFRKLEGIGALVPVRCLRPLPVDTLTRHLR